MARHLAGDLVPVSPVIAETCLEDDRRGAALAGRRDLDLSAVDDLNPCRDLAAAGRAENSDREECELRGGEEANAVFESHVEPPLIASCSTNTLRRGRGLERKGYIGAASPP